VSEDNSFEGRAVPTALLIKWADMVARSQLEAALRAWRLSSGQLMLLSTLERTGSASAADLARALHLTPQAMTTQLKPLEERGLIAREVDSDNRRRLSLALSTDGQALLAEVRETTDAVDIEISSALTPAELRQFRTLLGKISRVPRA
jgi:DNA-binding MarR family transcriptional regulator